MKTVYIPKGETVTYETLETERLVVKGCLKVAYGIRARSITGNGMIDAQTIHADDICVREIEAGSVICKRLLAEQVQTPELIVSDCAAVSTFLSAAYVKAGKLTVAVSEVDEVDAEEVVNLRPGKRGLLRTLILSALVSLWLAVFGPGGRKEPDEESETTADDDAETTPAPVSVEDARKALDRASEAAEDDVVRTQVAKTVREIMEENGLPFNEGDVELKRIVSSFLLLREQGYTLRVLPGTPEENAPVFDFASGRIEDPAA